jgi:hypothetical protein
MTISETNNTPSEKIEFTLFSKEVKALEVPEVTAYIISSSEYSLASARFPLNLISDIRFAAFDSILATKKTAQPESAMFRSALSTNRPMITAAKRGMVSLVTTGNEIPANSIFGPVPSETIDPKDVAKYPTAAIAAMSKNARVDLAATSENQTNFSIPVIKEMLDFMDLNTTKV